MQKTPPFDIQVVGAQYRKGVPWHELHPGQPVSFRRDPHGKTTGDSHNDFLAIAVYDFKDRHIGYLPKERASILAPLLDTGQVEAEGVLSWIAGENNIHLTCVLQEKESPA